MPGIDTPAIQRVLNVIQANPGLNGQEIARRAFVSYYTVKNHAVPKLIAARAIHISGWETNTYSWPWAKFSAGYAEHAPRPPNAKQRHCERLKQWRADSAYNEAMKAARRLAKPDPLTAALMGIKE